MAPKSVFNYNHPDFWRVVTFPFKFFPIICGAVVLCEALRPPRTPRNDVVACAAPASPVAPHEPVAHGFPPAASEI